VDYKEIGRIFYRDGYKLAATHLENNLTAKALSRATAVLYEGVDGLVDAFLKRSETEGKPAHCKKGCSWCCHQAVFTVTHEQLYLREDIHRRLSEKTEAFLEKAKKKNLKTAGKSLKEQLRIRMACPFLEDGACSVYEARPMACRIYLSSSVITCRREHDEPGNQRLFPELFEFPLQAGRMLNEGFVAYLKQYGVVTAEMLLEQGYISMMTLGQTFESWLS